MIRSVVSYTYVHGGTHYLTPRPLQNLTIQGEARETTSRSIGKKDVQGVANCTTELPSKARRDHSQHARHENQSLEGTGV